MIDRPQAAPYAQAVTTSINANSGPPKDLISTFIDACGLSWKQMALAVAGVLLLALFLAAYLDGYFSSGVDWSFRSQAYFAVTIPYMLVMLPIGKRLWERAMEGIQPLLPGHELAQPELSVNRRREVIVLLVGLLIAIPGVMLLAWREAGPGQGPWTTAYLVMTGLIANSLFTWMVYLGALGSLRIAALCKHDLRIDVFQSNVLTLFARWSQFGSIAAIGGIALTLPLQTLETLKSPGIIVSYSGLLSFAVLSFFIPLRRIHGALVRSKNSKLAVIRVNLQKVRADLEQHAGDARTTDITALHSRFAAWSLYEEQVKAASTWPFNHKMVRQVLGSTLVPATIYYLKVAGGVLWKHLLQ